MEPEPSVTKLCPCWEHRNAVDLQELLKPMVSFCEVLGREGDLTGDSECCGSSRASLEVSQPVPWSM